MPQQLKGKRVAIVVTDGFEQDELVQPKQALEEAGAIAEIVSPNREKVKRMEIHRLGNGIQGRQAGGESRSQ